MGNFPLSISGSKQEWNFSPLEKKGDVKNAKIQGNKNFS